MYKLMRHLILLALAVTVYAGCGNFCGRRFCGGAVVEGEEACNWHAPVESAYGTPCLDRCCKAHDVCCFNVTTTKSCNSEMAECLQQCDSLDTSCLYGFLPVSAFVVSGVMNLLSDWCCGMPC